MRVELRESEGAPTPTDPLTTQPVREVGMATRNATSIVDLAWAAGFLEGEGSFYARDGSAKVSAGQVQKAPLERLHKLFGGHIWLKTAPTSLSSTPIWIWYLSSRRSAAVMMTLYAFMSPKRKQEIEKALAEWSSARNIRSAGSIACIRGHSITGDNAAQVKGRTYPVCRACRIANKQAWRKRTGKT